MGVANFGRGTAAASPATVVRQQGLGPIQVIPPGLMGLLQLKQQGRLPSQLSETVVGVLELRDWYLTARRVDHNVLFGGVPQVAAGSTVTGQQGFKLFSFGGQPASVPAGDMWYVEQLTIWCNVAVAADVHTFACAIGYSSGNGQQQLGAPWIDSNQARPRTLEAHCERGFWAFPGDTFQLHLIDTLSVAGDSFQLNMRATICPI